jgi:Sulfotransferase family
MSRDSESLVFPPVGHVIHLDRKTEWDTGMSAIDRPVFVVGSGRSGTTLLQRLFNSSPEFLIWGEHAGILRQIASLYETARWSYLAERLRMQPDDFASREASLRDLKRWPGWDNARNEQDFRKLCRDFVLSLFTGAGREPVRWGFKEPRYGLGASAKTLAFLHHMFPAARTVILIRDPFATITSMVVSWYDQLHSNAEIDRWILKTARWWTQIYERLFLFHHEFPASSLILKYEDIHSPDCRWRLEKFLEIEHPLNKWNDILAVIQDETDKQSEFSERVRERLKEHWGPVFRMTNQVRTLYGYQASH